MSQYVCPDLFPRHTKTHDSPFELNRVPGDDGGNREVEPAPKYGQEDLVSSSDHVLSQRHLSRALSFSRNDASIITSWTRLQTLCLGLFAHPLELRKIRVR
jgi:hypothetical protein